jgi:hypothetical protein
MADLIPVASRLRASWRRSERYGISVDRVEPAFTGSPDTGSLLYECGHLVLTDLHATLANEPISLMLADSDGLVLSRLSSDSTISRSLDRVHLAPGFQFTEREAGTNGLGLALADRAPSLVKADEHYCAALRRYTCAAVPVLDPITGELAGSVNLTTWSDQSSDLLLALAQSAATSTAALMLLRSGGRRPRPAPRGRVFRVQADRRADADPCRSRGWQVALEDARRAMAAGQVLAVVGESGAGKRALVSRARRQVSGRERVLIARPPAPEEVGEWLTVWMPELGHPDTCVIVSAVQGLPAWAAEELAEAFGRARRVSSDRAGSGPQPFVLTASDFGALPEPLAALVDAVVEVPPLRLRTDDVLPLARFFARRERHREVAFTAAAEYALTAHHWPENVVQLERVVREASDRADLIDTRHLPAEVFSGSRRHLSRLETLERDEIVRCLTEPGATLVQVAATLGIGRATLYRKIAQYDLSVPGRGR